MIDSPLGRFWNLHEREEQLRLQSIKCIAISENLQMHMDVIEDGQHLLYTLAHDNDRSSDDEKTIRLLGYRLFNATASCLKLALSGYYQNSGFLIRDLLETSFLLDLLQRDRALISEWRDKDDKLSREKFRPLFVRRELDKQDDLKNGKRDKAYKVLCELAAHPTGIGFQMLRTEKYFECGPFFDASWLKTTMEELAHTHVYAIEVFSSFFEITDKTAEIRIGFLEFSQIWKHRFFGIPMNVEEVRKLRSEWLS